MCLLSADKPFCSEGLRTHRTDKSYTLLSKCKHAVHVRPHRPTPPMPSYIGEQCFTPFAFLMGYGQMLHCIPHQSVKLRSIALRRKRVSAKHGTLLRPARGKGRSIPRPFHFFPSLSTSIPCRSISFRVHSGFLHGAMRYCETLHSPSITFLSTSIRLSQGYAFGNLVRLRLLYSCKATPSKINNAREPSDLWQYEIAKSQAAHSLILSGWLR